MSKEVALVAAVAAGGVIALQAPVNNLLSDRVGTYGAATVNFAVGTACLLFVTFALAGGFEARNGETELAWWHWALGGAAGALYVTVALVTVRELGAGGITAATIAGQLTLSVVIDRLGVLGLDERAITWEKLVGIALLAVGTVLIVRE